MYKHLFQLLLAFVIMAMPQIAEAAVEHLGIVRAQMQYDNARSIEDYRKAHDIFVAAKNDPVMGNPTLRAQFTKQIEQGIAKCNERIAALEKEQRHARAPRATTPDVTTASFLLIENSPLGYNLEVGEEQATRVLDLSTNLNDIAFVDVPSWISARYEGNRDLFVNVAANQATAPRAGAFRIKAGPHEVSVQVNQAAHEIIPDDNFVVDGIEFGSTGSDVTIDFGNPLYAHQVRYLVPMIKYHGIYRDRDMQLGIKIIDPEGKMLNSDSHNKNFTACDTYRMAGSKGEETAVLTGVGWNDQSMYRVGTWTCEIWDGDKLLISAPVNIVSMDGEVTPLYVDGKMRMQYDFPREGGEHTFKVSGHPGWELVDVPRFCTLTGRTDDSFTLWCPANNDIFPRSRMMKVVQGESEVVVGIYQEGSSDKATVGAAPAEVKLVPGQDRVVIHVAFSLQQLVDHKVRIAALFWDAKGQPLKDTDKQMAEPDGQVSVARTMNVNDDIEADDYKLTMLAQQLHLKKGKHTVTYRIVISDAETGEVYTTSEPFTFDYEQK